MQPVLEISLVLLHFRSIVETNNKSSLALAHFSITHTRRCDITMSIMRLFENIESIPKSMSVVESQIS